MVTKGTTVVQLHILNLWLAKLSKWTILKYSLIHVSILSRWLLLYDTQLEPRETLGSFPCLGTALAVLQGSCFKILRSAKQTPPKSNLESTKLLFLTVLVVDLLAFTFGSSIPSPAAFLLSPRWSQLKKEKENPSAEWVRKGKGAFSFLPTCFPSHIMGSENYTKPKCELAIHGTTISKT